MKITETFKEIIFDCMNGTRRKPDEKQKDDTANQTIRCAEKETQ